MLLQDLHDRHVCNSLLVAESEEDIWKPESVYRKRLNTSDGESDARADAGAGSLRSDPHRSDPDHTLTTRQTSHGGIISASFAWGQTETVNA